MNSQIQEIFGLRQSVAALTVKLARRAAAAVAIFSGALFISAVVTETAVAQTLTTLYNFSGSNSDGGLVRDSLGNLYGTTFAGGSGFGAVFKLDVSNNFTVLHNFSGEADGREPNAPLALDSSNNLYGTTWEGGSFGLGTAFKLSTAGSHFSVLYNFSSTSGRTSFGGGLVLDSSGNLYGKTLGGSSGGVTVFKLSTLGGGLAVLQDFPPNIQAAPQARWVLDSSGNVYGTTLNGGTFGFGTVFKFSTLSSAFNVLHSFSSVDGSNPYGLALDSSGNLYGVTRHGGSSSRGTVFRLSTSDSSFSLLHNFSFTDGENPEAEPVLDSSGNLYGTTSSGGSFGGGTVFKLSTSGSGLSVLHNFSGRNDGGNPAGSLVLDSSGNLYGVTRSGGSSSLGTVFRLSTPSDSTPPVITPNPSGRLGNNGWYVTSVDVDWNVTDNESAVTSKSGCDPTTVNTDGSTTLTCTAISAGGTNSRPVTIKRDATAPSVSCGAADGSWHANDVSLVCIANDATSGPVNSDAFPLSTSVPTGTETAGAATNSRVVYDKAGNSASAGPIGGNKIDKKPPSISIASPAATSYLLNQAVPANYSCADRPGGLRRNDRPEKRADRVRSYSGGEHRGIFRCGRARQAFLSNVL